MLSADMFRNIGLVTRAVSHNDFWTQANDIAADLANGARKSTTFVKKLCLASARNNLETQTHLEAELVLNCVSSRDGCITPSYHLRN